jgi:hypothetical protein
MGRFDHAAGGITLVVRPTTKKGTMPRKRTLPQEAMEARHAASRA